MNLTQMVKAHVTCPDRTFDRDLTITAGDKGTTHITSSDGVVDLVVQSEVQADGSTTYKETGGLGGQAVDVTRDPACLWGTFGTRQVQFQAAHGEDQPGLVVDGQVIATDPTRSSDNQIVHYQFSPDGTKFSGHSHNTENAWTARIDGQVSGDKVLDDPQLYLLALDPTAWKAQH